MIKKRNKSGWMLCASKSYPGKFYYFNVLNGEAAWCLNENKVTNTTKKMNQNTQTEQDINNVYTPTIPLSKQFENKINENVGSINYVTAANPKNWWNSTNIWSNIGKHSDTTDMQFKRKLAMKPILKESKLNKLQHTYIKAVYNNHLKQGFTQMHCNKVKNPKTMLNKMSVKSEINDLRYVLNAKRRKPFVMQDLCNKINKEYSRFNDTQKVTLNIKNNNIFNSEEKYIGGGTADTNNKFQQASEWYLVADLNVLLEDYEFIQSYINKDENCHLYVPSVIQNQLKIISKGEHDGRSRVIVARRLLRHLESVVPRLNVPENNEYTNMLQIVYCCLEIVKGNYDVVLITKEIELIQTAKLCKIKAYHINDFKSNDPKNKHNLFLQKPANFDPFCLSGTIGATDNNCKQNISGTNKTISKYDLNLNENNLYISDINLYFSKLNINDKIFNIKDNVKNNLFQNKIVSSNNISNNSEFKRLFHNTSINKTVQKKSIEDIKNKIFSNKKNINIPFDTNNEININSLKNIENYTNVNLITKPLYEVREKSSNNILEDMLKKFHITNSIMENNLYLRFDEWVCYYEQIIEELLYIILQKNPQVNQPSPWFLHEGIKCLKGIYRENNYITNIIEKFLYYYDFSSENGTNIKPYNFMKLFGCGFILVEALEKTSTLFVSDIKKKLIYLRDMLECPIEDIVVNGSICTDNTEDTFKNRFVKSRSDILDYLKNNFTEWKNYHENNENTNQIEQKQGCKANIRVLRTFGKDLNKITINKSKDIHFTKETDKQPHKHDFQSNNYPKVIRNIKLLDTIEEENEDNNNRLNYPETAETISSISTDGNKNKAIINDKVAETNDFENVSVNNDSQNNDFSINDINDSSKDNSNILLTYSLVRTYKGLNYPETAETISSISSDGNKNKAIINDKVAETNDFENVSVNNDSQNNDFSINDINDSSKDNSNSLLTYSLVRTYKGLNYPETAETISSISSDGNKNKAIINDKVAETNDFENVSVNNDSQNNDFSINDINDSSKDNSNSLLTYYLVRTFLSELTSSFKTIHTFIDESTKDYNEDISEENKRNLNEKANKIHKHLAEIIDKLKIIMKRESVESTTLKSLLIKVGKDDRRTTRYRPIVMKCLEQAKILKKSLKLILSITNDDEVLSVSSEENIQFINIYE